MNLFQKLQTMFAFLPSSRPIREQIAKSAFVFYQYPDRLILSSYSSDCHGWTCYGDKVFLIPFSSPPETIASSLQVCLNASRWNVSDDELESQNKLFFKKIGVSQSQLDKDWDLIDVSQDLRDGSVRVGRMHRFVKRNGHGGDVNTPSYTQSAPVDWEKVGQEIRHILDLGTPGFLNDFSEVIEDGSPEEPDDE